MDGTVRFLKILVTTLTVTTTILGLIVLITVIVMRFSAGKCAQTAASPSIS